MDYEPRKTYRLTQFSLLNLVLMTTIVALGVTVYLLQQRVAPLEAEVKRLRDEVGELNIQDPSKLHAIQVQTDNQLEWKWRIYVPEGVSYAVRSYGNQIPEDNFPQWGGTMYLREPGEHVLRYVIRYDPEGDRWEGSLQMKSGSVGSHHQPWVTWKGRGSTSSGVGMTTQVFEPDKRVLITRRRYEDDSNPPAKPTDPLPGFMIWLEPQ
jgi:hypothetical protein